MTGPTVVIIGAGVVGAAIADELSARGWNDITVIDQGFLPRPGGSSSHAPGMVFQNHESKTMSMMAQHTVRKFRTLEYDGESAFATVGGLEIATTPQRMTELHRRLGWARNWGLDAELVSSERCAELQPLLDPNLVLGGLWNGNDGAARAVVAVNAQLRRAASRGVQLLQGHEVIGFVTSGGAVTGVKTRRGDVPAEVVVCCAGIWGPKLARTVGLTLPMTALEHQVAWTKPMLALSHHTQEATAPMLRHQDRGLYYRDRYDKLEIGSFAHRPMDVDAEDLLSVDEADVMPSIRPLTEDDFAPQWADTQSLMPATRGVEIEAGMNGIMAFTVDDFPLLGEHPDLRNFWFAEGVWVTHSAGVGVAMAEWLVDGYSTSFDLHQCDINRFEEFQLAAPFVRQKNRQNFIEVYDIKHPLQPMESPRPLRTSPFYPRQVELGAMFLEGAGWERPQWYDANATLCEGRNLPSFDGWAGQFWSPIVGAEAQRSRETVAMFDMSPLKRLEVSGTGAAALLQRITTGDVDRAVGTVTYCLMLNSDGTIRSDVTVARLDRQSFQVGVNGNADLAWLRSAARDTGSVRVRDVTPGTCCIGIWGPRARDVVAPIAAADFSADGFKYFRAKRTYIGNVPVTALRVSYIGELGWELYTNADMGLALWDTLWRAGQDSEIIAAGRGALNSLRLEKGYRAFGTDMTFEHDPYEAGLAFAVRDKAENFVGRDALAGRCGSSTRKLTCLTLDDHSDVVLGREPVLDGARCVGYVTSAAWGYSIGRGIAYAWLPSELATPGTNLSIGYFNRRLGASVAAEPLFDPTAARLRS